MTYEIGVISNTHGIKGELKIKTDTDFDRFKRNKKVSAKLDNQIIELKIEQVKETQKGLIVKFFGYDNINDVLFLKGAKLYTDEKPKLKKDEFHYQDLIGKQVVNQFDQVVGVVSDVIEVPQGHLLQVDTGAKKALIPFVGAFIKAINETIEIDEIEGLL